jgi:hypothetical protein
VEGCCECGNDSFGSVKCWKVPVKLQNWKLFKKGSAP